MTRPGFTVFLKNGDRPPIAKDANHLAVAFLDGNRDPVLTFQCSGTQEIVAIEDVIKIDFHRDGLMHCPFCDQALGNLG